MSGLRLSQEDVIHHVVSIGLDIFPQVEMRDERTRLNMFYEDARVQWPNLYGQRTEGESAFRISKHFREKSGVGGPAIPADTFVLTQRGPVFVFPLRLPDPVGATGVEEAYLEDFAKARNALWSRLPGHTVLRVGLVRDLLFCVGNDDCTYYVSSRSDWLGSRLVGGHRLVHYQDEKCNIRLEFSPGRIGKATQLPVGTTVEQPVGFGLKVRLDVNNAEVVRPLEDTDIENVIERASSFWPNELLEYLSGLGS